jgi:hypothetical protein
MDLTSGHARIVLRWNLKPPPNIPLPAYDAGSGGQYLLGYQYFGGSKLTPLQTAMGLKWQWTSSAAGKSFKFHSPIKLSTAKSYWAMAADNISNYNSDKKFWLNQYDPYVANKNFTAYMPPHFKGAKPAGGNEVFCDGSAMWCRWETMCEFSDWGNSYCFWYQDSADFEPELMAALPKMSAVNF